MSLKILRSITHSVVARLARGEYDLAVDRCEKSRLTAQQLAEIIRAYGRNLIVPPDDAYGNSDVVQIQRAAVPTWSVRAPLWTEEEGRSDLTLELTIALGSSEPKVELDDLHVL